MTRLGVGIFRDAGLCTFGPCCAYCEWASEQRGLRGTFRPWPTRAFLRKEFYKISPERVGQKILKKVIFFVERK